MIVEIAEEVLPERRGVCKSCKNWFTSVLVPPASDCTNTQMLVDTVVMHCCGLQFDTNVAAKVVAYVGKQEAIFTRAVEPDNCHEQYKNHLAGRGRTQCRSWKTC
jgi:hypothetical protein